jgi:epoxyqueuosine reductase QueG
LAGCVLAGLSYYQLYPTAENLNIEIDRNPKSQNEIIANQRGLNDVDSFKSDNNEIKNKDKTISANNSAINTNLNENTTYDNPSVDRAEIKRLWPEIQTPISFDHIKPKSKESAPQTNHVDQQSETFSLQKLSSDINRKENVEDLKYENSLINKEDVKNDAIKKEGIYAISNLPVDAMVPLSSNYVTKIQIAPVKIQ